MSLRLLIPEWGWGEVGQVGGQGLRLHGSQPLAVKGLAHRTRGTLDRHPSLLESLNQRSYAGSPAHR